MERTEIAIIGAGPYGLSLAAHLYVEGIDFRIFGRPMAFWDAIAKAAPGRFLKSFCFGGNIPAPGSEVDFANWSRLRGLETFEPCTIENYAAYGRSIQLRFIPRLWTQEITNVRGVEGGFELRLSENEAPIFARRVVVATGLTSFEYIPDELRDISATLITHSNLVRDFSYYRNFSVAVIGGGQSAFEAAALLHEIGARPHLIMRESSLLWMDRVSLARSTWKRMRSPLSSLGTGPIAWLLSRFPGVYRHLPTRVRDLLLRRYLPPSGAWWLRKRVEGIVPTTLGASVIRATGHCNHVSLTLSTVSAGTVEQQYDRVIVATGFSVDVESCGFLDKGLRQAIRRQGASTAPDLDRSFQTSVAGLYFVGPASAATFGPLFRFVAGARYTTLTLILHLRKTAYRGANTQPCHRR